ncbi:hypothetical protein PsorP6_007249 [Peronosclerospora sorghi]|uniref:Uncharacterized protein n=1 Tax=Peronosclerospora sorghi TaxID=230839 RepID=A0ACC0WC74_9STRA|nr:hypothetical protein PsorP6_007249 [Peronosclerospora sorghi]
MVTQIPRLSTPGKVENGADHGSSSTHRLGEILHTTRKARPKVRDASQQGGRPCDANQVPLTVTHEIRMLRAQATFMENTLHELQTKWKTQCPDQGTLASAYRSLREKYATSLSEKTQHDLQQLLRQQQLLFATLQMTISCAPLQSNGKHLFDALHFQTQLGCDPEAHERTLWAHHEQSLATIPSIMDKFSHMAIAKARAHRKDLESKSFMPLSQFDITGCKDCTLISNVFVTDIPHTSLEDVFAAVLAYFDAIPTVMKKHLGITAKRERLNSPESPVFYSRTTFTGSPLEHTVNNIMCSELTASHGMVHLDVVTEDLLHPVSASATPLYGICGLHVTPRKDLTTGHTLSVTLQWIVVYHYNMLPLDPAIPHGLEMLRPILNGDLITATICEHIRQQKRK